MGNLVVTCAEDETELSTAGSAPGIDDSSSYESENVPNLLGASQQIFLLMPADEKWSDKAKLIQYYFLTMHHTEISIVDQLPEEESILIFGKGQLDFLRHAN